MLELMRREHRHLRLYQSQFVIWFREVNNGIM